METEVLVIGAGMAGLLAARALAEAGHSVQLVDKGRGVGGRLAARRMDAATFDHGAQFLAAGADAYGALLETARAAGIVVPWGDAAAGIQRYRGVPAMTGLAKWLAQGLDLRLGERVSGLRAMADGWHVQLETGGVVGARAVVLTAPVPQALELLDRSDVPVATAQRNLLGELVYDPCLAVMAALAEPSRIPGPGWLVPADGPIAWLGDNQQKGVSAAPAMTLHATAAFSREWWEADRAASGQVMLEFAAPWLGSAVTDFQVHGWRYARPRVTADADCLLLDGLPPLVLAGDGFGGPDVEGAACSGWAAAAALQQRL